MALPSFVYRDLNRRVSTEANPILLDDEDAVLNAIECLFGTERGEREFLPEFGSNLTGFLFDPIDAATASKIRFGLIIALENWEPRVRINQSQTRVTPDPLNVVGYIVDLAITIVGLPVSQTYRLYLRSYFGQNR